MVNIGVCWGGGLYLVSPAETEGPWEQLLLAWGGADRPGAAFSLDRNILPPPSHPLAGRPGCGPVP